MMKPQIKIRLVLSDLTYASADKQLGQTIGVMNMKILRSHWTHFKLSCEDMLNVLHENS